MAGVDTAQKGWQASWANVVLGGVRSSHEHDGLDMGSAKSRAGREAALTR
eukprot:CAMPEP_0170197912 /NCGR_PEP_ID=MMETSP0040_2-20121228/67545_1 /TAXON_ID=641309 /ORGANISM="Lotharella oceanica, Strain CCMP622" /LENGTH=49 /DNA_ID=CAMNT_0010447715 /DNA_START=599 /DNA_END=748 /DNA_ORIENTATION=-